MPALNRYLEVSGADKGEPYVSRVCELIAHLPELADDDRIALLQIKNALFEAGFPYDQDTFLAQDVITKRRGNCLGLPLFMGVLFADLRRPPGFGIGSGERKDLVQGLSPASPGSAGSLGQPAQPVHTPAGRKRTGWPGGPADPVRRNVPVRSRELPQEAQRFHSLGAGRPAGLLRDEPDGSFVPARPYLFRRLPGAGRFGELDH